MNARYFPLEAVDYPKPLRSSPGCLAQIVEVLGRLGKYRVPPFPPLGPRRDAGHLDGRGQAAVEAALPTHMVSPGSSLVSAAQQLVQSGSGPETALA